MILLLANHHYAFRFTNNQNSVVNVEYLKTNIQQAMTGYFIEGITYSGNVLTVTVMPTDKATFWIQPLTIWVANKIQNILENQLYSFIYAGAEEVGVEADPATGDNVAGLEIFGLKVADVKSDVVSKLPTILITIAIIFVVGIIFYYFVVRRH